jgi:hypothetical protein
MSSKKPKKAPFDARIQEGTIVRMKTEPYKGDLFRVVNPDSLGMDDVVLVFAENEECLALKNSERDITVDYDAVEYIGRDTLSWCVSASGVAYGMPPRQEQHSLSVANHIEDEIKRLKKLGVK